MQAAPQSEGHTSAPRLAGFVYFGLLKPLGAGMSLAYCLSAAGAFGEVLPASLVTCYHLHKTDLHTHNAFLHGALHYVHTLWVCAVYAELSDVPAGETAKVDR